LDRWLEESERLDLSPTTLWTYRAQIKPTIRPRLGKVKLSQLSAKHLDDLYGFMKDPGKSPKTIRNHHTSDAFSEGEAVLGWEELHVDRRTVGPVIEDRPEQHLTMTLEEAAVMRGISRATAYDAVSRGEIPCLRIGRRILIPKMAMGKLLSGGSA